MRLTFSTDYALRLLMLVGLETKRLVTIEEVADRFGISKNHLMKVAYQLGQTGYLETVRGRNGGLRLGKVPSQIVVGEVVRRMEPDFAVVECQNPAGYCKIAPCCTLRSAMGEAVRAFLRNSMNTPSRSCSDRNLNCASCLASIKKAFAPSR